MPFKWKDFFSLAERLRDDFNDSLITEAAQRSAMSRAYYAAFCHARDVAIKKYGYQSLGAEDHSKLSQSYKRHMPKIAVMLEQLKIWRQLCDYDNSIDSTSLSAMINGMNKCKYVLNNLHLT